MKWLWLIFLLAAPLQAGTPPIETILEKVLARLADAEQMKSRDQIWFKKLQVRQELDAESKNSKETHRLYLVTHREGEMRNKLLEINGQPLSAEKLKEEEESGERRRGNRNLSRELIERFEFTVTGEAVRDGRKMWKIQFIPRKPLKSEKEMSDRIINRLEGEALVDQEDYEVGMLSFRLKEKVRFWRGVLGSVERMEYSVEKKRLLNGVWLPKRSEFQLVGRKVWDTIRFKITETTTENGTNPVALQ
ncbi:MAG: hypothetical protein SFY81_14290 [Verrucomicrobiota bacterium]|nr:hypothetical protein [Verrucomicrobiota bacterium]